MGLHHFLTVLFLILSPAYSWCVLQQPTEEAQKGLSERALQWELYWEKEGIETLETLLKQYFQLKKEFHQYTETRDVLNYRPKEPLAKAAYGKLPTVYADTESRVSFPIPMRPPDRMSWFQVLQKSKETLEVLKKTKASFLQWQKLSEDQRKLTIEAIESFWFRLEDDLETLVEQARYIQMWKPRLLMDWLNWKKTQSSPARWLVLSEALQNRKKDANWEDLQEMLIPKRIWSPSYLPKKLSTETPNWLTLPIATDISDRKFLTEVENAVDMHWNQSPWAKRFQVKIKIRWSILEPDRDFQGKRISLENHLRKLAQIPAAKMTTGANSTFVKNGILVLGPDRITHRTLAHEVGHLLGFDDCYLRTLSAQGSYGLAILEWTNPIYPDELMCDNTHGVARNGVW